MSEPTAVPAWIELIISWCNNNMLERGATLTAAYYVKDEIANLEQRNRELEADKQHLLTVQQIRIEHVEALKASEMALLDAAKAAKEELLVAYDPERALGMIGAAIQQAETRRKQAEGVKNA